jgi:hypothetical protein
MCWHSPEELGQSGGIRGARSFFFRRYPPLALVDGPPKNKSNGKGKVKNPTPKEG